MLFPLLFLSLAFSFLSNTRGELLHTWIVDFTMTNIASVPVTVLKWKTPLEDILTFDCITVTLNGEELQRDGIVAFRKPPSLKSYIVLEPGESFTKTLDLSKHFDLTKVGTYIVQVNPAPTLFPPEFTITTTLSKNVTTFANQIPRRADEVENAETFDIANMTPSNIISITISPEDIPNNPFSKYEQYTKNEL